MCSLQLLLMLELQTVLQGMILQALTIKLCTWSVMSSDPCLLQWLLEQLVLTCSLSSTGSQLDSFLCR